MQQQYNPKSIAGLVCGVVSLVFLLLAIAWWVMAIFGLIAGVVGLILSVMARKEDPSSLSLAGLIVSIVGVSLCALVSVSCAICWCTALNAYNGAVGQLNGLLGALD